MNLKSAIKYLKEFGMCNITFDCPKDCEGCYPENPCKKIEEFNYARDITIKAMKNEIKESTTSGIDVDIVIEDLDLLVEIARKELSMAGWLQVTNSAAEIRHILEKQIPKKPIYDSTSSPGLCPNCLKDDINILIVTDTEICERVKYCPNCGQKLDWE